MRTFNLIALTAIILGTPIAAEAKLEVKVTLPRCVTYEGTSGPKTICRPRKPPPVKEPASGTKEIECDLDAYGNGYLIICPDMAYSCIEHADSYVFECYKVGGDLEIGGWSEGTVDEEDLVEAVIELRVEPKCEVDEDAGVFRCEDSEGRGWSENLEGVVLPENDAEGKSCCVRFAGDIYCSCYPDYNDLTGPCTQCMGNINKPDDY